MLTDLGKERWTRTSTPSWSPMRRQTPPRPIALARCCGLRVRSRSKSSGNRSCWRSSCTQASTSPFLPSKDRRTYIQSWTACSSPSADTWKQHLRSCERVRRDHSPTRPTWLKRGTRRSDFSSSALGGLIDFFVKQMYKGNGVLD